MNTTRPSLRRVFRLFAQTLVFSALACAALRASADASTPSARALAAYELDRPHMLAEFAAGLITLPTAEVCLTVENCQDGETSIGVGIQNLYRFKSIGFGAGIRWATTLRRDAAEGAQALERDHSRRYFFMDAQLRYYAIRQSSWEWWLGGSVGGVVVNDSWTVKLDRDPYNDTDYVGPRAVTIGTEGLTTGLGIGAQWSFVDNWSIGAQMHYCVWFLPSTREESPTGDSASLSGRIDMIDIALAIAYRIAM